MAPRPRKISNHELLRHASDVLAERGVEHVRLTDVAAASQLAAATLIQRFGSREGLFDALAAAFVDEVRAAFAPSPGSPLEHLSAALLRVDGPRHFRFFASRPAQGAAYSLELRKNIGVSVAAAVGSGEVVFCDVALQARRLQLAYFALVSASLLEGTAPTLEQVQALVHDTLADYL